MILDKLPDPAEAAAGRDWDALEGFHHEWAVEDDDLWRVFPGGQPLRCRMTSTDGERQIRCENVADAQLNRGRRDKARWWAYCSEHLYGRVLVNGKIYHLRMVKDD